MLVLQEKSCDALQEDSVTADEVKYSAAARLAQLDAQVLDLQQDMAACLHVRKAAIDENVETTGHQLANVQVSKCPVPHKSDLPQGCVWAPHDRYALSDFTQTWAASAQGCRH